MSIHAPFPPLDGSDAPAVHLSLVTKLGVVQLGYVPTEERVGVRSEVSASRLRYLRAMAAATTLGNSTEVQDAAEAAAEVERLDQIRYAAADREWDARCALSQHWTPRNLAAVQVAVEEYDAAKAAWLAAKERVAES